MKFVILNQNCFKKLSESRINCVNLMNLFERYSLARVSLLWTNFVELMLFLEISFWISLVQFFQFFHLFHFVHSSYFTFFNVHSSLFTNPLIPPLFNLPSACLFLNPVCSLIVSSMLLAPTSYFSSIRSSAVITALSATHWTATSIKCIAGIAQIAIFMKSSGIIPLSASLNPYSRLSSNQSQTISTTVFFMKLLLDIRYL